MLQTTWLYIRCAVHNRFLRMGYLLIIFGAILLSLSIFTHHLTWWDVVDIGMMVAGTVLLILLRFGIYTTLRTYRRTIRHYNLYGEIGGLFGLTILLGSYCSQVGYFMALRDISQHEKRGASG